MTSDAAVATDVPADVMAQPDPAADRTALPRLIAGAVWAGAAVTVLFAVAMGLGVLPVGSYSGHFRYKYLGQFTWALGWPVAVVLVALPALLWLSHRVHSRFEWPTVLGWLAVAVPLQLLLRRHTFTALAPAVLSDRVNSFYSPTVRWSAGEFISRYLDILPLLDAHARTNMPGKAMLYYLLTTVTRNPTALGVLIMVVANLSALLAYLIVRDWLGDRRAALYALVLCLFVPGMIYFFPTLNVVSPVPILLALWLLVRFVQGGHRIFAVLLGPALYLTLFFEPLPMVLGLVFLGVLGVALHRRRLGPRRIAVLLALTLGSLVAVHLAMRLILGYDIIANFAYVLHAAHDFNDGRRPYRVWVTHNLWDFVISAGPATVALMLVGAWDAVRHGIARPAAMLTVSGLAVLAFVDLVGINRGETVRLWIFIAVLFQLSTAWLCARSARWWPVALIVCAVAVQGAVGTTVIGFIRP